MMHAKKIAMTLTSLILIGIVVLPMLMSTVDAYEVLESEATAQAFLGDSFYIEARGIASVRDAESASRALTKMYFEFTIIRNGTRGVIFDVITGYLVINETRYVLIEGLGFAGHPSEGRFNNTIVFGFRLNLTGPDNEVISVGFLGAVVRNRAGRPILAMRGQILTGTLDFSLVQRGIIRRIQS